MSAPAAPTDVRLAIVPKGLEAAWKPVSGATRYTLFWGSERGDYKNLVNCDRPAVVLSGLGKEQLYFFAVTAWNQHGESNFSGEQALVYDDGSGRPETYVAKGNDFMGRGQYASALAYFSAAIRLDPSDLYAYQSRAALHEKIHRPDLARQDQAMAEKLFKQRRISLRQAGRKSGL
jgi:tetratricopeptide (TPR) repeat protein